MLNSKYFESKKSCFNKTSKTLIINISYNFSLKTISCDLDFIILSSYALLFFRHHHNLVQLLTHSLSLKVIGTELNLHVAW